MKTKRPLARLSLPVALVLLAGNALAEDQGRSQSPVPANDAERSSSGVPAARKGRERHFSITSRSTEGLSVEKRGDGTIGLDLQGRFMYVLTAVPDEGGNLQVSCHTGEGGPLAAEVRAIQPWRPLRGQTEHRLDVAPLRAPLLVLSVKPAPREEK
jgi:hypothetical protein